MGTVEVSNQQMNQYVHSEVQGKRHTHAQLPCVCAGRVIIVVCVCVDTNV